MKHITFRAALAMAAVMCACTVAWAQLPTMRVTTQNNQDPTVSGGGMFGGAQTMNYVKITNFELTGAGSHNLTLTPEPAPSESDSIRVRGNSTAGADKKPYRIKFDKKHGLFGKTPAKSWVLLANYYDPTFTMNAIAFRLGHKLGLDYTPSSQFVNLYLNNQYKGIYQLTEQLQVGEGRVAIDPEYGYFVEFDYHDKAADDVKFTAAQYSLGTFIKSPEIPGCDTNPLRDCNDNNPLVRWVKDSLNAVMNKMAANGFPDNGYRDMIDLKSFAKYVLIQQFIDNFDFNSKTQTGGLPGSNYAYRDVGQKLKAGPLWDFDLSAGVKAPAGMGGFPGMGGGGGGCEFPTHFCMYDEPIKPKHAFYQRLWADPEFIGEFKAAWEAHKSDFGAVPAFIDSIANVLSGSVANNKYAASMSAAGTLNASTYSSQISSMKTWWNNRTTFFNTEVGKLSGSTPPVTGGPTLQVSRNPSAGGNVSVTIGTGSPQNNPSGQLTAAANTSISITATANANYKFVNWTAVSGSLPSGITATNPSITFTITAAVNIRANFEQDGVTPPVTSNYTLQVSRQTDTRGSVSVTVGSGSPQSNPTNSISVASGASVSITAVPNDGCSFVNWTAASGSALPSGITATSASIEFTMSANVNITANFVRGGGGTTYTLTVDANPQTGGGVTVNGASATLGQAATIAAGETVTLVAAANSGYAFREWTAASGTSLPSGVEKNSATIAFAISGNVGIIANFRESSGGGNRTDTIKIEAEDFTSSNPANVGTCPASPPNNQTMCVSPPNSDGVVGIGYINSGNSATYRPNIASGGMFTLVFKIASNGQSTFGVTVNGVSMGTISGNTGDWDGYTYVTLDNTNVPLDAGENTIVLDFRSSVNVDYFLILGESAVGVRYGASGRTLKTRNTVTLRASPSGFAASLPANHGYTSYRLVDMRGREIKRGKIGRTDTDLRFNGLNRGVMFLRLEGSGGKKPLVLKAATY